MKRPFLISTHNILDYTLGQIVDAAEAYIKQGKTLAVQISDPTRSIEQNDAQWPILHRISKRYLWPVNGAMSRMDEDGWKNLLTSAFRQEQAMVAQAWDGNGVCLIGHRTRDFTVGEFSDWIEFLNKAESTLESQQNRG